MKNLSGFTLIELMVVIAIIGVLVMVTYPRLSGLIMGRKLMGFCGELAGILDYVRARAVTDGRIYYVYFNRSKDQYWVTREEGKEEEPMEGKLGKPRSFPENIFLKKVKLETKAIKRSEPVIRFFPRGNSDGAIIYLETEGGDKASIRVKPYTGRCQVFNYFYGG